MPPQVIINRPSPKSLGSLSTLTLVVYSNKTSTLVHYRVSAFQLFVSEGTRTRKTSSTCNNYEVFCVWYINYVQKYSALMKLRKTLWQLLVSLCLKYIPYKCIYLCWFLFLWDHVMLSVDANINFIWLSLIIWHYEIKVMWI